MRPHKTLNRTADIVFTKARVAVFVDGCFWHGCPEHRKPPKTNTDWWVNKITRNRRRDQDTEVRLCDLGWTVIRVWEHENPDDCVGRILNALGCS